MAAQHQIALSSKARIVYRFGVFELDPDAHELRKQGIRIHLPNQACHALVLALESEGRCVTREELRQALWPDQQSGDFDVRLNKVVNRIRQALGDSAGTPRYLETLPKVGYRFLVPVQKDEARITPLKQETAMSVAVPVASAKQSNSKPPWAIRIPVLIAGLVAVAIGLLFLVSLSQPQPLLEPVPLTRNAGTESDPSFSPTGEELAFSWNGNRQDNFDIYVLSREKGTVKRLTEAPERDFSPSWSPDGQHIAFLREMSTDQVDLMLMAANGGGSRALTRISRSPMLPAIAWTSDSRWIVAPDLTPGGQSSLFMVSAENGRRRQITSPSANSKGDFFPAVSQDGSKLAFTRFLNSQWNDIFVLALAPQPDESSHPVRLSNLAMRIRGLTWTGDDREIVFSGGAWDNEGFLYRMSAAAGANAVDLASVRIEGLLPIYSPRAGALAYARRTRPINIWQMEIAPDASKKAPERIIVSSASDRQADLSPDGKLIVFSSNRSGKHSLWIARADGSEPFRLASMKQDDATAPRWSPDGRVIAFESGAGHQRNIYLYNFSMGTTRKVTDGFSESYLPSWSRDGRTIYFCSSESGSPQIWKVAREGGEPVMVTRHGGYFAVESTDGKDLYFTAGESGTILRKQSLATGAEQNLIFGITTVTATAPGFGVTAGGIFYMKTENSGQTTLNALDLSTHASRQLVSLDKSPANGFSVSLDGKRILFALRESDVSELMLLRSHPNRYLPGSFGDWFRRFSPPPASILQNSGQ